MAGWLVRLIAIMAKAYLKAFPFAFGKHLIWNRVLRPFVLPRNLALRAVTAFGALVDGELPDVIHAYLYFLGVWEPGITKVFSLHLRPGDCCIDIGANVGAHTLLAAHLVGPAGQVHAIEASPSIYNRLSHNLRINGLTQVVPHNVAVIATPAPVTIYLHAVENLGGTTVIAAEAGSRVTTAEITVEGQPLTAILPVADIIAARLIKIDVEGAEWLVLQGMLELLPVIDQECLILIELSARALAREGRTIADVVDLFASSGWMPLQVANPYRPRFYFRPPGRVLSTTVALDATQIDLGFARPRLRDALLAADRSAA